MDFKGIVADVESLPPLSDAANTVRRLYAEGIENVNINKLVIAIESDAVLAANILKMINSPFYGFSKQIGSVSQAVTLFGTQMIYGLVVSYAVHAIIVANLRAYGSTNKNFNNVCQLQSILINKWYSPIDMSQARFLTPLALIMESGKLLTAREITQQGKIKEFNEGFKEADNYTVFENSYFGTSSYFVSGLLFEHWNLESHYVAILKGLDFEYENSSPQLAKWIDSLDVVRTAINVGEVLTENSIKKAANLVYEMGLNTADFINIAREIKNNYENN